MTIKMAKASKQDLECASRISAVLECLEKGFVHESIASTGDGSDEWFDIDDSEQCRRILEGMLNTCSQGSIFRVVFGMEVVLDSGVLDPAADTLELHPDYQKAYDLVVHSGWAALTAPGQISPGDFISFTLNGSPLCVKAHAVINPGTDREEVIYNRKKNHYFITTMAVDGTSQHKAVHVRACRPPESKEAGNDACRD